MSTNGELRTVTVVTDPGDETSVLAVFPKPEMARDWILNEWRKEATSHERPGVVWGDGVRVSLIDPRGPSIYEWDLDYTSEPTQRRRELRQQAAAKLTDEELGALGLTRRE